MQQNATYFGMRNIMPKIPELYLAPFKILKFLGLGRGSEDSFEDF